MLKKAILILLISGSLIGCSSTVAVHKPVECLPVPVHYITFTDAEKQSITPPVASKITTIMTIYKQRIIANCKIMQIHNDAHEVK